MLFRSQAARFVREHDTARPFFLYVAYTAAHWPMHAREREIAAQKGRYAAGYAAVRQARYAKMLTEGVVTAANTKLFPFPAGLGETGEFWPWDERTMEVFAAMVTSMDRGIGRIMQAIGDRGQAENTLVLYMQDNGGCAETVGREQAKEAIRKGRAAMAGGRDTFLAYGEAWSTVSNTPFRRHKHWVQIGRAHV